MKYGFIARHRCVWPTRTMCRVLGVSASGFYDWFERPQSKCRQANVQLLVLIRDSFAASDRTYGSPRILRDLQAAGEICSVNRVARLMQAAGIKARHKRCLARPTGIGRAFGSAQPAGASVPGIGTQSEMGG